VSSKSNISPATLTEKAGVIVFARIITTVIDLALAIAVVRLLSKTDFAIMGYVLMIHEIARNVAVLGFPDSIFYYFERITSTARRGFALQTVAILLISGILAGLAILGFNLFLPSLLNQWPGESIRVLQQFLPLMAVVSVLEIPTWPTTNILLASDRQKGAAWYEMSTSIVAFGALVLPLAFGYGLEIAIWSLVGYSFIRFVGSMVVLGIVLPKNTRLSDSENILTSIQEVDTPEHYQLENRISLLDQAKFSLPLGLSSLVGRFNKYIDKFIVSIFLVNTAYAEYSVAANEVPLIKVIPLAVGSVLISRYVQFNLQSKKDELLSLWYKGIEKVSLLVIPMTILFTLLAPELITFLFETEGVSYANAVLPFQLYNLIVLIRVTHYGSILQAFGDTKGVFYFSLNLLAANVILSVPMTIYFGIVGTALGTLIANLYNWLLLLRRIGTHMELPFWKVLPFPFYGKVLALSVGIGLLMFMVKEYWLMNIAPLYAILSISLVYLVIYVVASRLIGLISQEDWTTIKSWAGLSFLR
jgi:O-antigen/teichoic acid export membrane protein